jgi:AcrR family transcriptional regulator
LGSKGDVVLHNNIKREKEKKIQDILASAEELFISEGCRKFTMSGLSDKIGLSRGIIYYYFKCEENIIAKLIADKLAIIDAELSKVIIYDNGYANIEAILYRVLQFIKEEPIFLNLISYFAANKMSKEQLNSTPYYSEYEKNKETVFNKSLTAIKQGIADGSIRSKSDPYVITYAIWAGIGSYWEFMLKDNLLKFDEELHLVQVDKFISAYFALINNSLKYP